MATKKPNPFDNLKLSKENMRQSVQWFQSQIKTLRRASYQSNKFLDAKNHMTKYPAIGQMVMFSYDPKYAEQLPYYDTFPLIFVIDNKVTSIGGSGFFGVNLHYLPPPMRIRLLSNLFDLANNDSFSATTRLKVTTDVLLRLSRAKNLGADFAFKHYLNGHVKSNGFVIVPPSAWPMTACLPIENFQKASKQKVWHDAKMRI